MKSLSLVIAGVLLSSASAFALENSTAEVAPATVVKPAAGESGKAADIAVKSVPAEDYVGEDIAVRYRVMRDNLATSGFIHDGGLEKLAKQGIGIIVDIRLAGNTGNEKSVAEGLGLEYHNIPVDHSIGINKEQVEAFAKIYENAEAPVLLHCMSGNRVGALWAAYLITKGVDKEEAIKEGLKAGMGSFLEQQVRSAF